MICVSCKDQLSQFYVMKQQVARHKKPSDIRKMEIVDMVTTFLDSTEADCIVSKYSKLFAIHPDTNNIMFNEQLQNCSYFLDGETLSVDEANCVKEEDVSQFTTESYELTQVEDAEVETIEIRQFAEAFTIESEEDNKFGIAQGLIEEESSPKRRRKYQKSSLDPKQREWVRKELKECAFKLETSFGSKTQWCCSKCPYKSFSSENAFRIHLKAHLDDCSAVSQEPIRIIKKQPTVEDHSYMEQKLWIQEQLQSQKEVMETSEGLKIIWTCSQCDFTASKRGRFRTHLQKIHTTILMRGPNKHSCFECHLRFDGENHLQVHRNCHRIFDVIAPYATYSNCVSCKMFFCSPEDLESHRLRHNENPESIREIIIADGVVHRNGEHFLFDADDQQETLDDDAPKCGHCLLKFMTENECKNHLMLFHATSFTCPFDLRVFDGIPTLSFGNHLRQCHPDIFPNLEIACSFCKMLFETVYDKLAHMKICKAKAFQCDHCEKSFFRKGELLHHLKVSLGLTVFAW